MIIIVGNLTYQLMSTIYGMFTGHGKYGLGWLIILALVDGLGIYGVLWLLRSYRRTLRALKKQKLEEQEKKDEQS
jgi:hypothetical protein